MHIDLLHFINIITITLFIRPTIAYTSLQLNAYTVQHRPWHNETQGLTPRYRVLVTVKRPKVEMAESYEGRTLKSPKIRISLTKRYRRNPARAADLVRDGEWSVTLPGCNWYNTGRTRNGIQQVTEEYLRALVVTANSFFLATDAFMQMYSIHGHGSAYGRIIMPNACSSMYGAFLAASTSEMPLCARTGIHEK